MMRKLLFVALLVASAWAAAEENSSKVDEYLTAEMKSQHVPGVSLAVIKNGVVVEVQGYGFANLEHMVPVHPDTIFQSGSVGKQFTAAAVLMLVEEGKIGLDDPISKYFENAPASWKEIKVRNLLSHTSGVPDYENRPNMIDLHKEYSEDDLLKFAMKLPLDFKPGEKWKYSNTGYVVLGILIHKVNGQFYGDMLRDRIFKPLGMNTARVISDTDIVPNRAAGYEWKEGKLKNQDWVSASLNSTADGALYLTMLDLIKWDAALREHKLLKPESYQAWWTPMTLNSGEKAHYGFGWFLEKAGDHRLIEHTGQWQGFTMHIGRYVDDDLTVIVQTNLAQGNPKKMAHAVAEIYGAPAAK
jgi:CubicO group peptidase (beta-lactamase class C family)